MVRLLIALLCVLHPLSAQPQADEAAVWRNFVEWAKRQPPIAATALIPNYKPQLVRAGLSEAQADEQLSLIRKLAKEKRLELDAIDFDKYYAGNTSNFSKQPNAFLGSVVTDLKPGSALDVAMGQGRNSLLLAQKGWDVTGFDITTEGLRLAREQAEKAGVKIHTVEATHQEYDYGKERWDLVVLMYA
jgi:SAM-dependent methyltransferase